MKQLAMVAVLSIALTSFETRLFAGSLNPPPGPIAPTDRVTVNAQSIALPYTINQPGSYVLTSNLAGVPGQNGIVITAGNVTLDLNGFSLSGPGLTGIRISGALSNIAIRGGVIAGWSTSGISGEQATSCSLSDITVSSTATGVVVGSSWYVRGLNVSSASSIGLQISGNDNRIDGCHISNCGTAFQVDGTENLIIRNSAGGGNGTDYVIAAGNAHGPVVNVGGVGDISAIAGADHPWANFAMSCLIGMEVCDGVDNNCNNQIDESDPQVGAPCGTGLQGICGVGAYACNSGTITCEQTEFGMAEQCNGVDDNCDGAVDEGNPCPVGNCSNGACVLFSNGTPCTLGSQCSSSFCVDNVCCNTSCNGTCQACTAALKGSGLNGTCGPIATGTDPQNECEVIPNTNCNGAGGCGP